MLSKLCKYGLIGLRQFNEKNSKLLFRNTKNVLPLKFSSNSFSSENNNIDTFDEFSYIPNIPIAPEPLDLTIVNALGESTFSSLGLNNYTPSGLIQFIFENVHIYLDIPWWACIITCSIIIKTVMIPVLLNQRRVIVKYQNDVTNLTKLMVQAIEARKSGDSLLMVQIMRNFEKYIKDFQVSILTMFKPILIQAPVFFSAFIALKGMANVPVPSLTTGGLWWFTDLTVCDPYYILPLITAGSLALMIEMGTEIPNTQGKQIKFFLRCMAPISFIVMSQFPATLLLYWTTSNMYSLIFTRILIVPSIQEWLKLPKPNIPDVNNPMNYGLKESMEILSSMQEVIIRENAEKTNWERIEQHKILSRGLAAAEVRKKIKETTKQREKSTVDVVGEIIDNEKQKNKF